MWYHLEQITHYRVKRVSAPFKTWWVLFCARKNLTYPIIPLIFLGACFHIIFPQTIIRTGISKLQTNINHQNHIRYTSPSNSKFLFPIKNNFSGFTKSTIFIPVERPKNSVITNTYLFQFFCRFSNFLRNDFSGSKRHHKN